MALVSLLCGRRRAGPTGARAGADRLRPARSATGPGLVADPALPCPRHRSLGPITPDSTGGRWPTTLDGRHAVPAGPLGARRRRCSLPGAITSARSRWHKSMGSECICLIPRRQRTRRCRAGPSEDRLMVAPPVPGCGAERCSVELRTGRTPAPAGPLLGMCMPFRRPRVWAGSKPAIPMRACAGVVHASGSRRLRYPMTTFARPQAPGPGGWAGRLP